jgi:hypothetical protein
MGTCHTVKTAKPPAYQPINLDQNEDQNALEEAMLHVEVKEADNNNHNNNNAPQPEKDQEEPPKEEPPQS